MKRRELKRKAESRSIFSMFPAKKKGDMVKSASSIVDVVTPVEIFERNQKCLASCDIGLCVKSVKNMKDKEIIDLVNNVWKPLTDYDFPKTTYNGIKVSCKFSWLSKYKWLVYSESLDALFCLPCLVFCHRENQINSRLCSEGLRFWRSASSKLKKHDNLLQHKRSVMDLTNFIHTRENPSKSIDVTINKIEADLIRRNRTQISPVIACVEFLGKNNIALRGHRDDSRYYLDEDSGKNDFLNFVSKLKHKWGFTLEKCV